MERDKSKLFTNSLILKQFQTKSNILNQLENIIKDLKIKLCLHSKTPLKKGEQMKY